MARLLTLGAVALLVLGADPAAAQFPRGGPTDPSRLFEFADRNGDGRLDPDEIQNSRFIRPMLENAGVDTSRPVSRDEFVRQMTRAREEGGGGSMFFRPSSSPDRSDGDPRFDADRRRLEYDQGRRDDDRRRDDGGRGGRSTRGSSLASRSTTPAPPPPRVTVPLQSEFTELDLDGDGQISFLEWRQAGRSLAQFNALDANGDGFLTPRELKAAPASGGDTAMARVSAPSASPSSETTSVARSDNSSRSSPSGSTGSSRGRSRGTSTGGGSPVASSSGNSSAGSDEADFAAQATRMFDLLDVDRDGAVSSSEWQQSRRVRSMFESGRVDLSQPIKKDEFVRRYVELTKAAR